MTQTATMNSGPAIFEDGLWYYYAKSLTADHQIEYRKEGGYQTQEEAERAYAEQLIALSKMMGLLKQDLPFLVTLKDYLVYWFNNCYVKNQDSKTSYIAGFTLYRIVIPALQDLEAKPLNKLTVADMNRLLRRCGEFSKHSRQRSERILSTAFKDAELDEMIVQNPMNFITRQPRIKEKPTIIYSKEQLQHFFGYCAEFYRQLLLEFALAFFCGMRAGEIRGLRFDDCDPVKRQIHIQRQITRDVKLQVTSDNVYWARGEYSSKTPKCHKTRVIPAHPYIFTLLDERRVDLQVISERRKSRWTHEYDGFVSIGMYGAIKCEATCTEALKRICCCANLPVITMHDLRHMCATYMFDCGEDLTKVARFLGHENISTTYDIYVHALEAGDNIRRTSELRIDPLPDMREHEKAG